MVYLHRAVVLWYVDMLVNVLVDFSIVITHSTYKPHNIMATLLCCVTFINHVKLFGSDALIIG